jgi:hypothetical protein
MFSRTPHTTSALNSLALAGALLGASFSARAAAALTPDAAPGEQLTLLPKTPVFLDPHQVKPLSLGEAGISKSEVLALLPMLARAAAAAQQEYAFLVASQGKHSAKYGSETNVLFRIRESVPSPSFDSGEFRLSGVQKDTSDLARISRIADNAVLLQALLQVMQGYKPGAVELAIPEVKALIPRMGARGTLYTSRQSPPLRITNADSMLAAIEVLGRMEQDLPRHLSAVDLQESIRAYHLLARVAPAALQVFTNSQEMLALAQPIVALYVAGDQSRGPTVSVLPQSEKPSLAGLKHSGSYDFLNDETRIASMSAYQVVAHYGHELSHVIGLQTERGAARHRPLLEERLRLFGKMLVAGKLLAAAGDSELASSAAKSLAAEINDGLQQAAQIQAIIATSVLRVSQIEEVAAALSERLAVSLYVETLPPAARPAVRHLSVFQMLNVRGPVHCGPVLAAFEFAEKDCAGNYLEALRRSIALRDENDASGLLTRIEWHNQRTGNGNDYLELERARAAAKQERATAPQKAMDGVLAQLQSMPANRRRAALESTISALDRRLADDFAQYLESVKNSSTFH